ncbi:McrC family protein [Candidatus Pristimantibacillus sp. PTI5]|uniref:McrC family protein n=1 Tax=Candidatus Pristimantibacillus sp. PTI5 TaxID=3400422 RepID=UPI003B019E30
MSKVLVVREAFDWLEARPDSAFTEEDLKDLIVYMSKAYPKMDWMEFSYNRIRFINVVGTIRLTRVQIDIIPKLRVDTDEGRTSLLNMLAVCGHVPYRLGTARSSVQVASLDLLTWIASAFCIELDEQLKRGVPADYINIEENSMRLKGRIKIPDHLRMNAADKSRVFCAFDERTTEIPINTTFYKTILVLKRKVQEPRLRRKLQYLSCYFEDFVDTKDFRNLIDKVRFDRQNLRFKPAFQLAKLILSRMSVLHRGSQEECLSFLFEVNTLYETYIGRVLQQMRLGEQTIIRLQHEQVRLLKNEDSGRDNIQLIPDIVLGQQHANGAEVWNAIIDTKWKTMNYQQDDIYQMYAYVTGYRDAKYAVLLYPKTDEVVLNRNWTLAADSLKRILVRSVRIGHLEETRDDLNTLLQEFEIK